MHSECFTGKYMVIESPADVLCKLFIGVEKRDEYMCLKEEGLKKGR